MERDICYISRSKKKFIWLSSIIFIVGIIIGYLSFKLPSGICYIKYEKTHGKCTRNK